VRELAWDDVRCFLAVAKAGSFSGAARALGVEHSTLSRRIRSLEQRLGLHLFQATPDGVRLSPAATDVLDLARAAEERISAVERKLSALSEGAARVRMATSGILASALLAPHLGALLAAHPALEIELEVAHGLAKLTRGEADVALRLRPPGARVAEPSVIASVLARVGWAAYASTRGAPARAAIVFSGPTRPGAAWLDAHASASRRVVVDDVPTAMALARAGVGTAVLPCFFADGRQDIQRCSPILSEHRLVLAMSREQRRFEPVRAVANWLREVAASENDRLRGA
jgi:DNA-binding transcriptional LysR family regulator